MVYSMTGYGQTEKWYGETKIQLEIKTVNHRFLDLSLKMPQMLNPYEDQIKSVLRSFFIRGRIELFLTIEGNDFNQQTITVNWPLLEQYQHALTAIQTTYPKTANQLIRGLPEFTDVLQVIEKTDQDDSFYEQIIEMLKTTCQSVQSMRLAEGEKLAQDISQRVEKIDQLVKQLTDQRDVAKDQHYARMVTRLNELLAKNNLTQDERFYRELAILAEKGDISEELTRINSHLIQIKLLLEQSGEVGRKMDFITQELIREANTISSKANDPLISGYVIELKSTVEKIKEQVQNIE
ncbi:YicC/YloC family endoribonuclease [Amphibacillus indicireducens]|uniref:YicC family protein n=1 Tax=Amphibacillus indicireducens TaxID=1076330 RepID=A0ABP7VAQ2_9BACI